MFLWCTSLKEVILSEGLESIGEGCFSMSGLEEITIPKSVETIEWSAFYRCESLWKVVFQEGSELKEL